MFVDYAVQTSPPLIRRFAPPSPKIRGKAYKASANIGYGDIVKLFVFLNVRQCEI